MDQLMYAPLFPHPLLVQWARTSKKTGQNHAILGFLMSDVHFVNVVEQEGFRTMHAENICTQLQPLSGGPRKRR